MKQIRTKFSPKTKTPSSRDTKAKLFHPLLHFENCSKKKKKFKMIFIFVLLLISFHGKKSDYLGQRQGYASALCWLWRTYFFGDCRCALLWTQLAVLTIIFLFSLWRFLGETIHRSLDFGWQPKVHRHTDEAVTGEFRKWERAGVCA